MMRGPSHRPTRLWGMILLVAVAAPPRPVYVAADPVPQTHKRFKVRGAAFHLKQLQVEHGTEQAAKDYYSAFVSPHLKFLTPDTILTSSLTDLLKYFGYTNVAPSDLHRLSSDELMKLSPKEGEILATRFFAPKISTIGQTPDQPSTGFGWRKLVRFKARPGSEAEANGMQLLVFLQNLVLPSPNDDAFDAGTNVAQFNQAIVVRKGSAFNSTTAHAIYFLTYGTLVKVQTGNGPPLPIKDANGRFQDDGRIIFSLKATFDRDPETLATTPQEYFVPDSCRQCHGGGSAARGKLNFLDTDHWFDRVKPDYGLEDDKFKKEDFTEVDASPHGVLYDGGKDEATAQFKRAFDVIAQFNQEVADQNAQLGAAGNFQLLAVQKWLALHKTDSFGLQHVPPYQRGLGNPTWEPDNQSHRKLLYYLNRYCYRCHSSVRYNVYDLQAVKSRSDIPARVSDLEDPTIWMPQDRPFPGLAVDTNGAPAPIGDLQEFLDLLGQLH